MKMEPTITHSGRMKHRHFRHSSDNSKTNRKRTISSGTTRIVPMTKTKKKVKESCECATVQRITRRRRTRSSSSYSYDHLLLFYGVLVCSTTSTLLHPAAGSSTHRQAVSTSTVSQAYILRDLYNATKGDGWVTATNWVIAGWNGTDDLDVDVCDWFGISCEDGDGQITRIELVGNQLSGNIPSALWTLPRLRHVNFKSNWIIGTSWGTILASSGDDDDGSGTTENTGDGEWAPVETILLSENQISSLDGIRFARTTLKHLDLNNNLLAGSIPHELFQLTKLESLHMASNHLTGTLPTILGQLTSLEELVIIDNQLTGSLPTELGLLGNCRVLGLSYNYLNGTIPTDLENMVSLRELNIVNHNGRVEPTRPHNLGDHTTNSRSIGLTGQLITFGDMPFLSTVYLDGNSLTGPIPVDFLLRNNHSDSPIHVGLTYNNITGSIPQALDRFEKLNINLAGNRITDIPQTLCAMGGWMGGLVEEFACSAILCPPQTYNLQGRVTGDETNNECLQCSSSNDDQRYFGATSCVVSGTTSKPEWTILGEFYASMGGAKWINNTGWKFFDDFVDTDLTKQPDGWENISVCGGLYGIECSGDTLAKMSLPSNELFGTVPDSIFLIPWQEIDLSGNNIHMESLGSMETSTQLKSLRLSSIKLKNLDGLEALTSLETLYLDGLEIQGQLPESLFALTNLHILDLQHGLFTGSIPSSIGQLQELRRLNVFDNLLTGQLPTELGLLSKLHSAILGSNSFSGSLPSTLDVIDDLVIHAEDNFISFIPPQLCNKTDWMHGHVGEVRCDAILCPPKSWNIYGKQTAGRTCRPCELNVSFYGQTHCGDEASSDLTDEKAILDSLFARTGGLYWTKNHSKWLDPDVPICSREGIVCATAKGHSNVLEIDLSNFGLRGVVSSDIWQLPTLRQLKFSNNAISIEFNGIEKASSLMSLKLTDCHLRQLDGLRKAPSSLKEIHLASNQFDGSLPADVFGLVHVEHLWLNNNNFVGRLPSDVGRLKSLRELWLQDNMLTGQLPKELGNLSMLKHLSLKSNDLSGIIPSEIQNMPSIQSFDISHQHGRGFFGSIPTFDESPNLVLLDLSYNSFSGVLPSNFLASVNPNQNVRILLSNNNIVGQVPESWEWFTSLELDLSANKISSLPDILCAQNGWQNGLVGLLDTCDAILCPPGTQSPFGRQRQQTEKCSECPGGTKGAPYYGTRECTNPKFVEERIILTSFFHATNGTNWLQGTNWLSNRPVCSWYGVTCNTLGLVESVDLKDNMLINKDSSRNDVSQIFHLSDLKKLDLKGNDISLDFFQLQPEATKLDFLRLSATKLSSLEGISRATQLKSLHVTNNVITTIPDEIYSMTSLKSLFLSFNKIAGQISPEIGHLTNLRELYLFGNSITGRLPTQIGLLESLVELVISNNKISGEIPGFDHLSNLEQFSIYNQHGETPLTGRLPSFAGVPRLTYFDASDNDLTGTIPDEFMANSIKLNESISIYLRNNRISGAFPKSLSRFQNLDIDLSGNKIEEIPEELCVIDGWMHGIVEQIQNCSAILCPKGSFNRLGRASPNNPCLPCADSRNLEVMGGMHCDSDSEERAILMELFRQTGGEFWTNNSLWNSPAPVCSWYGITCEEGDRMQPNSVRTINLSSNSMSGTLPSSIWTLSSLLSLQMNDNPNLIVRFDEILNAKTLESLSVSRTGMRSLKGLEGAAKLKDLVADGNSLTGTFPEQLLSLRDIEKISLGQNLLFGKLPTRLGELTNLKVLDLFSNDFFSTIPSELSRLNDIETLVLSENIIYGEIPVQLSSMPSLQVLAIHRVGKSGPRLSGRLPEFDKMPNLLYLNLQGNQIQNSIPTNFLNASSSIRYVGLSSNQLTGMVPHEMTGFDGLHMEIHDNQIIGFPAAICNKTDWMSGSITKYSCDGFLCPKGYANEIGRSVNATNTCTKCAHGEQAAPFFGSQNCETKNQRQILTRLYHSLSGDQWHRNDFWLSKTDVCSWYGIACVDGKVVEINLGANNLRGTTIPGLFFLPELQILWLHSNPVNIQFDGIGRAKKLYDLRLDSTNLKSLRGIGEARSLMAFDARYTKLRGAFPSNELLKLSNLRSLSLGNNKLSGNLPQSWDKLRYLVSLDLSSNQLSGTLPTFGEVPFLANIDLSDNVLTGSIPRSFLSRVSPDRFEATKSVALTIRLQKNRLEGVVPPDLSRFDQLSLFLADNQFLGLPMTLCEKNMWNDGDVEEYGCNAILCPPGSWNPQGRMSHDIECIKCPRTVFYGSTVCHEEHSSSPRSFFRSIEFAIQIVLLTSCMIVTL